MPTIRQRSIHVQRRLLGQEFVEFTRHAASRMKQRGITQDDVYRTVESPDEVGLKTQPGRHRVRWQKTPKTAIDVVYEIMEDAIRIVTTMKVVTGTPKGSAPTIVRVNRQSSTKKNKQRKPGRRKK